MSMLRLSVIASLAAGILAWFAQSAFAADKIVLQLKWLPRAQFAGYYVAQAKGFYADADLEVEIRPLTLGTDMAELMAVDTTIDVATEWMPIALQAREQGVLLINIAQPFARSAVGLICRRDSNLRVLADLRGKRIGVWPGDGNNLQFKLLLEKLGIKQKAESIDFDSAADARLVTVNDTPKALAARLVDCITSVSYNDPHTVAKALGESGFDEFLFEAVGLGMLEDGLYVLENRLEDPAFSDALARFVAASMKGWRFAEANQAEAVDIVINANPDLKRQAAADPAIREHQTFMMARVAELTAGSNGTLELESYNRTVNFMLEAGLITRAPDGAWTPDITDRADIHPANSVQRLFAGIAAWMRNFVRALADLIQ